jgi:hypothetical protein
MRRLILLLTLLAGLAGAASALASSTVKPSYVYTGKTAQGIPVRLAKAVHDTRAFRYRATMTCNDGSTYLDDFFSDDVTLTHDHFSSSYTSDAGAVSTKVTGTLTGAAASGTVRIIERFSEIAVNGTTPLAANGAIICDSKTVRWSARA